MRGAILASVAQARPAADAAQPGHVRGRGRRGDRDEVAWIAGGDEPGWFTFTIAVWLWLTVLFGNVAEAVAEGRGKAQAEALRAMRAETVARLRDGVRRRRPSCGAATWSSSTRARSSPATAR